MADNGYDITLMVDGGSRGNPGPAAIGAVIIKEGREAIRVSEYIGEATNNEAEYMALIEGLKRARELGAESIHVKADSQLIVKQLLGHYKIRSANIRPLHAEATEMLRSYAKVGIEHVPRELNEIADGLVNEALDAATGKKKKRAGSKNEPCPKVPGPGPVICFLSDFGLAGADAAIIKGRIKESCPAADILDITHLVEPNDVRAASSILEAAAENIKAVVHLAIVVSSSAIEERGLAIATNRGDYLVGPDNGILLAASRKLGGIRSVYSVNGLQELAPLAARLAAGDDPAGIASETAENSLSMLAD